jgi:ribose/xylose/arabinose/galactoside ABC-type transport system permease subunit
MAGRKESDEFMNQSSPWRAVRGALKQTEGGLAIAILVALALTTLLDPRHTYLHSTSESAETIGRNTVMLGIFALGSAIVIIAGGIDLSSGSMIAFGASACATIMLVLDPKGIENNTVTLAVITAGIVGAILVGFLVGCLHAWLITVIGLPPFIATLATMVGLRSFGRVLIDKVNQEFGHGGPRIYLDDAKFRVLGNIWVPVGVFFLLTILCWILMSRTVAGRHLYALGGNEQAARLSGIRTDRLKWLAYCISAMTSAIAGVLYFAYFGSADPREMGQGYELNSIAAAVVGGSSLAGGIGTIPGTALGCLFLQVVIDGVGQVIGGGDADKYRGMIVGVVVAVAVTFNQLGSTASRQKQFFPGLLGGLAILTLGLFSICLLPLIMGKTSGLTTTAVLVTIFIAIKLLQSRGAKPSTTEPLET